MELRLLRYFLAVAEELHFGKAAEKLNISQPPLSQQIRKFEMDLGVRLFNRTKRSVSLTAAGKVLKEEAETILRMAERAERRVREAEAGKAGMIALGYVSPAMDGPLPAIIREFSTAYPGVNLALRQMPSMDQLAALRAGTLSLGIVRLFGQDTGGLTVIPFHWEEYILAIPDDHRLCGAGSVPLEALENEPLILFPRPIQPQLHDAWLATFAKLGFTPRITQEVTTKHAAVALTAAGLGISIIPESTARAKREGVSFSRIAGETPELVLHVAFPEGGGDPLVDRFLEIAGVKSD